jgi:hypothetical protein
LAAAIRGGAARRRAPLARAVQKQPARPRVFPRPEKQKKLKLSASCGVLPAMNFNKLLLAATVAGGLLSAASAAVVVTPLVTDSTSFTAPAPVKVVAPTEIPRRYQNETIRVSLTVDEAGRARNLDLLNGRDPSLVKRLLPAVAQWQFKPATKDGQAIAADVILPLQLVDAPSS